MTTDATTTTDPRPAFAQAATTAGEVIAAVRPDQLALPTPCAAFDVRALVEHLLAVPRRVAQVGRGGPLTVPDRITGVDEGDWARAWGDAVRRRPRCGPPTTTCSTARSRSRGPG